MKRLAATITQCLILGVVGCAAPQPVDPAVALSPLRVVLVAGDKSAPVFDNATKAMAANLMKRGIPRGAITFLSADAAEISKEGVHTATLDLVKSTIRSMHPGPGQGCLVFATSHGGKDRGLYLSAFNEFLTPDMLDDAITAGCGDSPSLFIISACYAGSFVQPPMARSTRVVLTAARIDRQSFGCGAGRQYTYYDECLLKAVDRLSEWHAISVDVLACVVARERGSRFQPSEPQAFFGGQTQGMTLPGKGGA